MGRMRQPLRLIAATVLTLLAVALPGGADAQEGAPHLSVTHQVSPETVSGVLDELSVAITVSGRGDRVGDLPLEVRDRLPHRPLEVVLVVDRSGSMESDDYLPTRLDAARRAAEVFLQQIQPGDSAAVLSFSEYATLDAPLTEERGLSLRALNGLYPDGSTAIGDALYHAIEVLEGGADESVKAVVLLSDGASNEGRDPLTAAREAADAGIPVFTVGIATPGDEFDERTLRGIADTTGGEYLYALDASELSRVYERMGGKVINVAGVNASLVIDVTGLLDVRESTGDGRQAVAGDGSGSYQRFYYYYDQIPVGEERTVHLRGWPTAVLPGERAPVIEAIALTYQSLGSERERVVTFGPVEVEFDDDALERAYYLEIDRIRLERNERDYPDSDVYLLDDAVRTEVVMNQSTRDEEVVSYATIINRQGAASTSRSHTYSEDAIGHVLEHPGYVGSYTLPGNIGDDRGLLYDTHEEEFYVVFQPPRRFTEFVEATTLFGDWNLLKGKFGPTTVSPRHPRILEATADLLALRHQSRLPGTPTSAALIMALNLRDDLVEYQLTGWRENNDHHSDLDILHAGLGDCSDMMALYISMARSLNIPARGVAIWYGGSESTRLGHAFAELYIDGEWVQTDPTWRRFDDADAYTLQPSLQAFLETSPGILEYDRQTTLKYAVGLVFPMQAEQLEYNLDRGDEFETELLFRNSGAPESRFGLGVLKTAQPQAQDVRIRVLEDQGLDIGRVRLRDGRTLNPGEWGTARMEITVPEKVASSVPPSGQRLLVIAIELEYGDGDGGSITKSYPLTLRLYRGDE